MKNLKLWIILIAVFIGIAIIEFSFEHSNTSDIKSVNGIISEDDSGKEIYKKISSFYDIPLAALKEMQSDVISSLITSIESANKMDTSDTYWKISDNNNGGTVVSEATYQEYLDSIQQYDKNKNSWIKIHMAVLDKADCAEVAVMCTWLTKSVPHLSNVIGLSILNGIFLDNSGYGFYRYVDLDGSVCYMNFDDNQFSYSGTSIISNVNLKKSSQVVSDEIIFMKADVYKEEVSEIFTGVYAYQTEQIVHDSLFLINEDGILSNMDDDSEIRYHQSIGRISI